MKTITLKFRSILVIALVTFFGFNVHAAEISAYCGYLVGSTENAKAYISIETLANGDFVMSINPFAGDRNTAFRNDGYADGVVEAMTVNDDQNVGFKYFTRTISDDKLQITFTPVADMMTAGDVVYINGILEYATTGDGNLWPTYQFTYTYGSVCAGAPTVSATPELLSFSPYKGEQKFTISGENLTGPITLSAPKGLTLSTETLTPDAEGVIAGEIITVNWVEGSSGSNSITVTGGGLINPKMIAIASTGFSDYCNKIINYNQDGKQHPAYLTINVSEDKKEVTFSIAPVYGETATWNGNSLPVGNVLVNEVAPTTEPVKTISADNTEIKLTFDTPLADNDIVSFGSPLVWTTSNSDLESWGNCFIDAIQTYTVGLGCELATLELPEITNVSFVSATAITANVQVVATEGTLAVAKIRFSEENDKVDDITLDKTADNNYVLTGLTANESYSFEVYAVDAEGNESVVFTDKLVFTTSSDTTSLKDNQISTYIIYPNPVKDVLYINSNVNEIAFFTLQGQRVLSMANVESVDVSGLSKGLYIVQITDELGDKASFKIEVR
ncbi:T9SS C-terminal target domain-containing protein [Paludibacter sp. 221]|uniref:T9SS type A sorting domain-containing protein n=1 Tax=Paludibacter sp. 221 TaxID=2302939 RepID=UPI0013D8906B|nr:T9SS type A sorting domain-containing protein [Paludibacter sp. 221]NDV46806.1 T9SS C-terminal target domain-containing protein [Paludibacter sp. 221]